MTEQRRQAEVKDLEEAPAKSLPTIWECSECGSQIQVVIAPGKGRARQPFQCACGHGNVSWKRIVRQAVPVRRRPFEDGNPLLLTTEAEFVIKNSS
jgi:hypothetical protein